MRQRLIPLSTHDGRTVWINGLEVSSITEIPGSGCVVVEKGMQHIVQDDADGVKDAVDSCIDLLNLYREKVLG